MKQIKSLVVISTVSIMILCSIQYYILSRQIKDKGMLDISLSYEQGFSDGRKQLSYPFTIKGDTVEIDTCFNVLKIDDRYLDIK